MTTSEPAIVFVFCGNGPGRADLLARCAGLPNVRFLDLRPLERLPGMLASARPVIATAHAGTELAQVVGGRGADLSRPGGLKSALQGTGLEAYGLVVPPEDAPAFAQAVRTLAADLVLRERLGAAGFLYAQAHLDKEAVLTKFEAELLALFFDCSPVSINL